MRIGIDARFYGSVGKGLGRYTQKLIAYLEQLDRHNEYVIFLRLENFDEYRPGAPNFTKALADYQWYSFEEQWRFPRLLARSRLDLMHFPHFNVPLLYRGRFVVTLHDLILFHYPTRRATRLKGWLYWFKYLMYRIVIRHAVLDSVKIFAVSQFTKDDLLRHYRVPSEKIIVTYEAGERYSFWRSEEETRTLLARLGLLDTVAKNSVSPKTTHDIIQPYLLYVGNAYPHKNLERLLRAAQSLAVDGIRLLLVGKEDYFYARLKAWAVSQGIENVVFAGAVDDHELDVLYRYARGYVFPSLYEGFGLPPLEAMSKGVPVAAAKAASLPEILGEAALYFNPLAEDSIHNALLRLWTDDSLRRTLRERGYRQAARYSWERMARETLQVYRQSLR